MRASGVIEGARFERASDPSREEVDVERSALVLADLTQTHGRTRATVRLSGPPADGPQVAREAPREPADGDRVGGPAATDLRPPRARAAYARLVRELGHSERDRGALDPHDASGEFSSIRLAVWSISVAILASQPRQLNGAPGEHAGQRCRDT